MTVAALLAALAAFALVLRIFRVVETAADAAAIARGAAAVLSDRTIGDDRKERELRQASLRLFGRFFRLFAAAALALLAPAAILWLGDAAGVLKLDQAVALATGWPFVIAATLAVTALMVADAVRLRSGTKG